MLIPFIFTIQTDVMGRTEEIQYLRETLQRTREKLEQEQRLNSAIKAKKVNVKSITTKST